MLDPMLDPYSLVDVLVPATDSLTIFSDDTIATGELVSADLHSNKSCWLMSSSRNTYR